MVIEAWAFTVYRPPRRSLLSVTTELSSFSHSFCRSLRRMRRRELIAGAIRPITFSDAQRRPPADLPPPRSGVLLTRRRELHDVAVADLGATGPRARPGFACRLTVNGRYRTTSGHIGIVTALRLPPARRRGGLMHREEVGAWAGRMRVQAAVAAGTAGRPATNVRLG